MVDKKIIWSDNAKNELRKVLEFYNQRNGSEKYSLKILNEIKDLLKTLAKSELAILTPETYLKGKTTG